MTWVCMFLFFIFAGVVVSCVGGGSTHTHLFVSSFLHPPDQIIHMVFRPPPQTAIWSFTPSSVLPDRIADEHLDISPSSSGTKRNRCRWRNWGRRKLQNPSHRIPRVLMPRLRNGGHSAIPPDSLATMHRYALHFYFPFISTHSHTYAINTIQYILIMQRSIDTWIDAPTATSLPPLPPLLPVPKEQYE